MSLSQKALGGVLWASAEKFGGKIITLISSIILYRLLPPEDFGTLALVTIFFAISMILIDSGFGQALIREEKISEEDKSTTFYINLITAVVITVILWFSSPFIASYFEKPLLTWLVRLMALSPVFLSISIVQRAIYAHRIDFRTQAIISVIAAFLSGASSIVLAVYGLGVWALAIQYVVLAFVTSFLFWGLNPWIPGKFINKDSFDRLFGFGSKLMLSGLLNVGFNQIYRVIIGKMYSTTLLGFYSQAENFKNVIVENFSTTLVRVIYPTLSKVKEDKVRLKRAYVQILKATSLVAFPALIGIILIAEPMILTLVGEKWAGSVSILQILAVGGAIHHLNALNLDILKVLGRSDLFLKLEIIKKTGVFIAILIGIKYGFQALIIGQVVSVYVSLIINMTYTSSLLNYSKKEQIMDVFPIALLSLPMTAGVLLIDLLNFEYAWLRLLSLTTGGFILYLITNLILKPDSFRDLIHLFKGKFPILKRIRI